MENGVYMRMAILNDCFKKGWIGWKIDEKFKFDTYTKQQDDTQYTRRNDNHNNQASIGAL